MAGNKRAAPSSDGKTQPRKRQRTRGDYVATSLAKFEEIIVVERTQAVTEDKVFRFMELPGDDMANTTTELRNRVYEYAVAETNRRFPQFFVEEKKQPRRGRSADLSSSNPEDATAKSLPKAIPHLGLSQACSTIRSEFRPAWLSAHKIPFCVLDSYLKVFYPPLPPPGETRRRFETYQSPTQHLEIRVRNSDMRDSNIDILRFLKHLARFPSSTVGFEGLPDVRKHTIESLEVITTNKNAKWKKWIKGRVLSQFRLQYGRVHIVVKQLYADKWMWPALCIQHHMPEGYLEDLGLSCLVEKMIKVEFAVDFS